MPNVDLQRLEPEFDWFGFVHGLMVCEVVIFEICQRCILLGGHLATGSSWFFHALFQPYKTQADSNCFVGLSYTYMKDLYWWVA